ncbi:MAG TPA: hypothetical protein VIJ03_03750 [Candidatus Dormibacteraeota bacterium]
MEVWEGHKIDDQRTASLLAQSVLELAGGYREIGLVVTVKAYPAISQRHGEAVCVAGIRTDTPTPRWARLWPIQFRSLPIYRRFAKYQEITLLSKPGHDGRPETWTPDIDTIKLGRRLSTKNEWAARRAMVEPLLAESMCEVQVRHALDGTSLAVIRPGEVLDLVTEPESDEWDRKQQSILDQMNIFVEPKSKLEKIPYAFKLRYRCQPTDCPGHTQSIVDWEIGRAYQRWTAYPPHRRVERIRQKWLQELCGPDRDALLFVGNMRAHPKNFLVLGIFWPPKRSCDQLTLKLGS